MIAISGGKQSHRFFYYQRVFLTHNRNHNKKRSHRSFEELFEKNLLAIDDEVVKVGLHS